MKNSPLHNIRRLAGGALLWLGLGLPLGAQTNYTPYHFAPLAGNGYIGYPSRDGTGSAARFNGPSGIAMDTLGNLFIADTNNHTIRKMTPAGAVTTFAGLAGVSGAANGRGAAARFSSPVNIAIDRFDNLYVLDAGAAVRKITPDGVVTQFAVASGYSIAADAYGNVYVGSGGILVTSDIGRIQKITPDGVVTTLAGTDFFRRLDGAIDGTGPNAHIFGPAGIVIDRNGNLLVADNDVMSMYSRIRKITPAGVVTTIASLPGFRSWGVTLDASGNIIVTDSMWNSIAKISADGVMTTLAGTSAYIGGSADGTGAAAQFNVPQGVAADANGSIFVADAGNQAIRKITPGGVVTTVAGLAPVRDYGWADGTGPAAQFANPSGLAVDANGNVYVTEGSDGGLFRKVTPAGVVTTVGSSTPIRLADGSEQYLKPTNITVDAGGNVIFVDHYHSVIWQMNAGGVVTILAGIPGSTGSEDGTLAVARFNSPRGVAVDGSGNIFVADTGNYTIRRIAAGSVTTLAGLATYNVSFTDGTGGAARFVSPIGVAVDANGNVFVADSNTVRKITPAGVVTTLAGSYSSSPTTSADGTGPAARFKVLTGVAVDRAGNVLVTESDRVRRVTPDGIVTTLAVSSYATDVTGANAPFFNVQVVAADAEGNVFVADSNLNAILRGSPNRAPVAGSSTVATPNNQTVTFTLPATDPDGDLLTCTVTDSTSGTVTVTGDQATYRPAPGFVGTATLNFTATDGYATSGSGNITITVNPAATFLVNISSRGQVGTGDNALIAGFVLVGTAPKPVLIRAAGPALIGQNVSGTLAQPVVTLFRGVSRVANQRWSTAGNATDLATTATTVGAFSFAAGSNDSAILTTLTPGVYSAVVSSADGNPGVALVEIYDGDTANPFAHPVNLSTRGQVGTGDNVLIAGVAVTGVNPLKLLIRAVGPTLATAFGLSGTLGDPQLTVCLGAKVFAQNRGWNDDVQVQAAAAQTGAFALPAGSKDAAALVTLNPGNYTVIVNSLSGATGLAMVEVYQVP